MSMLTPENREKLLDEEKRYWQETCLLLRDQREDMALVIRTQNEELAKLREDVKDQAARLSLITDIQIAMRKTGAPLPDWSLGGVTYETLSSIFVQVTEYKCHQPSPRK